MTLVTNVFRRGGSYYFRVRVPGRFRALLARNELSRSLRTGDPPTARLRASLMSVLTNQLWRDLERAMSSNPVAPTSTQVQSLIDQWLRAELNEDAYLRSAPDGEWHDGVILQKRLGGEDDVTIEFLDESGLRAFRALTPEGQKERLGPKGYLLTGVTDLDLRKAAFRKPLKDAELRHRKEDGSLAEKHVADVFRRAGLDVSPFTETFEAATRMMMRAHRDVLRAVKQRDNAVWRPELDDDPVAPLISSLSPAAVMTAPPKPEPETRVSGTTLTHAVSSMLAEARQTGLFTEGRAREYETAGRLFVGWLGNNPDLAEVTPAVAGGFREVLTSYPLNASKRSAYKDLSIAERIAKAKADGDTKTLSPQTANNKYLDPLRQVFDWAKKTGRVSGNPFTGISVSKPKGGSRRRRHADFTQEQLQTLFSAPLFVGSAGDQGEKLYRAGDIRVDDWRYWLPLMALYSGARLNELCGLRIADFDEREGIPFFHVRALAEHQSLKTEGSERVVPVHQALIDLGLLRYVDLMRRAGEDRLFPTLQPGPRGHLSHIPSKFFGRLIDRMLGADATVVFHSFRHTFITKMREARVAREVRTALVGHEDGSTHEGYGSEPMTRLNEGIQAVKWEGLGPSLRKVRLTTL